MVLKLKIVYITGNMVRHAQKPTPKRVILHPSMNLRNARAQKERGTRLRQNLPRPSKGCSSPANLHNNSDGGRQIAVGLFACYAATRKTVTFPQEYPTLCEIPHPLGSIFNARLLHHKTVVCNRAQSSSAITNSDYCTCLQLRRSRE